MLNELGNILGGDEPNDPFAGICSVDNLYTAWRKVRANRGVGGVDAVSLRDFEKNLQDNLQELSRNLLSGTYQPLPVKFVRVMKANGKIRELGILTIRDRVAQRGVLDAIESRFEALMQDCNFAFRLGRNLEMAIQQILLARANGFWWTVEADVEDYFGSINREILLSDVRRVTTDGNILNLIRLWLDAGILEETWWQTGQRKIAEANAIARDAIRESFDAFAARQDAAAEGFSDFSTGFDEADPISPFEAERLKKEKRNDAVKNLLKDGFWLAMSHRATIGRLLGAKVLGIGGLAVAGIAITPAVLESFRQRFHPRKGILQGSPLSPVLANLYLTNFDEYFMQSGSKLVRYCDDFVILCRSEQEAVNALQAADRELAKRGLRLHPEKTRILSPTDEFELLGYRFLSDGSVEPPPNATNEMGQKLKAMSKSIGARFRRPKKEFRVKKYRIRSWKEYFDLLSRKKKS